MAPERPYDVVLFGVSGFVGRLTADYLAGAAPPGTRIALAGRSRERVERVRAGLAEAAAAWPVLVVDAGDEAALAELAASTSVVATTVGPYATHGLPLVAACAAAGTHYADLTGEITFMRTAIDRYDAAARASGARIVHGCGFDSIPSDLGVLVLAERVRADGAGELQETTFAVTGVRGGVSGGTVASMQAQLDQVRSDPALRRLLTDPYSLSPDRAAEPVPADAADLRAPTFDRDLDRWLAPFVMAMVNTRVVRRSNALSGYAYGRGLRYREVMAFPPGPTGLAMAVGVTAGTAALAGGLLFGPTRTLLGHVLPQPGEGPSPQTQANGYFRIEIHTTTSTGARYLAHVAGTGDPGYAATSVMFGESALCLALDGDRLPDRAGVLTPATGIGEPLVQRLRARGFTFDAAPAAG